MAFSSSTRQIYFYLFFKLQCGGSASLFFLARKYLTGQFGNRHNMASPLCLNLAAMLASCLWPVLLRLLLEAEDSQGDALYPVKRQVAGGPYHHNTASPAAINARTDNPISWAGLGSPGSADSSAWLSSPSPLSASASSTATGLAGC